jgi:hypothetical protein
MKYYKVLKENGECCNGGNGKWYLPKKQPDGSWKPGRWMPAIEGELILCKNGYHICRPQDLVNWLDEAIFEVEYTGEIREDETKCVVRNARLLRKMETWNDKAAQLFAADCAEHVLPIYEKEYPDDDRPRKAVQATRDYANGKITSEELYAVVSVVMYASHAPHVAWCAARSAECVAESVKYAAEYASHAESEAYAVCALRYAERKWQTEKLMEYLEAKNDTKKVMKEVE